MIPEVPCGLVDDYVIANTPLYLLDKLRSSEFVNRLTKMPTQELLNLARNAKSRSPRDVAGAYAAVLAMLIKGEKEEVIIGSTKDLTLDWLSVIIALYQKTTPSFSLVDIDFPRQILDGSGAVKSASTTSFSEMKGASK